MGLRSVVYFRVRSNRPTEFINAVHNSKIHCSNQKFYCEEYTGKIYRSDLKRLQELAEQKNAELYIDGCSGGFYRVMKYKKRFGIIAGIIFTAFFIFISSSHVIKIEINGNERISDGAVLSVLEECGLKKGAYIPDINFDKCELYLKFKLDGAGWAAVRNRGGRVIIDINEDRKSPGTVQSNIPCNIISEKSGVVVSVYVHRGSPAVKAGDTIEKGDIIVSGIISNDKWNHTIVHAEGEAVVDFNESQKFLQKFEVEEKVYTEKVLRKYAEFFGFHVPLFFKKNNIGLADITENTEYFSFMDKELPIGIYSEEYSCYEIRKRTLNEKEVKILLAEKVKRYEENFYSEFEIKGKEIKEKKYDGGIEYQVFYTVRGKAGVEKELFVSSDNNPELNSCTEENQ